MTQLEEPGVEGKVVKLVAKFKEVVQTMISLPG